MAMDSRAPAPGRDVDACAPRFLLRTNSGCFPIRAPPSASTDDDEQSSDTVGNRSINGSSASSEATERFASGEEDFDTAFDTASERPFFPDPEEETTEIAESAGLMRDPGSGRREESVEVAGEKNPHLDCTHAQGEVDITESATSGITEAFNLSESHKSEILDSVEYNVSHGEGLDPNLAAAELEFLEKLDLSGNGTMLETVNDAQRLQNEDLIPHLSASGIYENGDYNVIIGSGEEAEVTGELEENLSLFTHEIAGCGVSISKFEKAYTSGSNAPIDQKTEAYSSGKNASIDQNSFSITESSGDEPPYSANPDVGISRLDGSSVSQMSTDGFVAGVLCNQSVHKDCDREGDIVPGVRVEAGIISDNVEPFAAHPSNNELQLFVDVVHSESSSLDEIKTGEAYPQQLKKGLPIAVDSEKFANDASLLEELDGNSLPVDLSGEERVCNVGISTMDESTGQVLSPNIAIITPAKATVTAVTGASDFGINDHEPVFATTTDQERRDSGLLLIDHEMSEDFISSPSCGAHTGSTQLALPELAADDDKADITCEQGSADLNAKVGPSYIFDANGETWDPRLLKKNDTVLVNLVSSSTKNALPNVCLDSSEIGDLPNDSVLQSTISLVQYDKDSDASYNDESFSVSDEHKTVGPSERVREEIEQAFIDSHDCLLKHGDVHAESTVVGALEMQESSSQLLNGSSKQNLKDEISADGSAGVKDLNSGLLPVDCAGDESVIKLDNLGACEGSICSFLPRIVADDDKADIGCEQVSADLNTRVESTPVFAANGMTEETKQLKEDDIVLGDLVSTSTRDAPPGVCVNNSLSGCSPDKLASQATISVADYEMDVNADLHNITFSVSDKHMTIGPSEKIIEEIEQASVDSHGYPFKVEGQIISDSDKELETDEEDDSKEVIDSNALAALLKAASSAGTDENITVRSSGESGHIFSVERPAGLGPALPSLRPAVRPTRPSTSVSSEFSVANDDSSHINEEEKKLQAKIHQIRIKFLRLVQRLGHSSEDNVASQVLYRLNLAEGIRSRGQNTRSFSVENAKKAAARLESTESNDLDFSFNVLILGKTGVGKSATINSIFGEVKSPINAFAPSTATVKEISGMVDGVKIRVIDTPGLGSSVMDRGMNQKILLSIKKFTKKYPPDTVLYVDRLDARTRDFNDIPLLRSISTVLGSSVWLNTIVALTHAASAPPDGSNGSPLSYEIFVAQRSHIVQHSIRQAAGDMRLMNPVALVENHPSCRKIRGQSVLPNGQIWRSQLLLLCYSSKILSEANDLMKLPDSTVGKLFGIRFRPPPLPFLLSSLLQSRAHPKLSADHRSEIEDSDIDLADYSDSDHEGEDEYDQLPPFKPLRRAQMEKLSKEQRNAYLDEYDYRTRLLQKKQLKEEIKRVKELKKRGKGQPNSVYGENGEDFDPDDGAPAAVPVPLPDMVLPPSFDGDYPGYRYRFLEPISHLLVRPVLDTHGWDHDCGYDGVSLEENIAIGGRFPVAASVQVTKDKKEFNIHLESSMSAKHGENGSSMAGFDIQAIGRQLAYILRGETKFKNLKRNRTALGASLTFMGEHIATGVKLEDQITIGRRFVVVGSTGSVKVQGDKAFGANLEARLRDKDYPVGQNQSTLGLSLMRWRGDLALGANLQSQFSVGRNSKLALRIGLNNKLSGQITVRVSSSEHLHIALTGLLPIASVIFRTFRPGESFVH